MSALDEQLPPVPPRRTTGRLALLQANASVLRLGDLVAPGPTLHATDSLGKALRTFATSGRPLLPVVEGDALMGVISEQDVLEWIADTTGKLSWMDPTAARQVMVMQLMRPRPPVCYADELLEAALPHFEKRGIEAMPVLDTLERFHGMLPRSLALEALTHGLRPERVGGMATPFGIFLTTGNQQAGVGAWALASTGALVVVLNLAIMAGLAWAQRLAGVRLEHWVVAVAGLAAFLVLLRLSPLAGLHAAEHQVVNALEGGEPLDIETVAGMPREHPRCGTNLLALLFGAQLLIPLIGRDPLWLLPAAAALLLGWRRIGTFLQRWFTTRPARPAQIASGLAAGSELLRSYAERPAFRAGRWQRVWNMGVLQVLMGSFAAMAALELVHRAFPGLRGVFF